MEWFGWLTKPHLQVSFLDKVIGFSELVVAIVFFAIIAVAIESVTKRKKR